MWEYYVSMEYFYLRSEEEWWWTELLELDIIKSARPNNMHIITLKELAREHWEKTEDWHKPNSELTNQVTLILLSLCNRHLSWSAVYNIFSNFLGGLSKLYILDSVKIGRKLNNTEDKPLVQNDLVS